jgi:hypothetical protein
MSLTAGQILKEYYAITQRQQPDSLGTALAFRFLDAIQERPDDAAQAVAALRDSLLDDIDHLAGRLLDILAECEDYESSNPEN